MAQQTVLSCFSGAGGLDLGLEAAGFQGVAHLETVEAARRTLAANRPHWYQPSDGDVVAAGRVMRPVDLGLAAGQLDLVAGGPPCQPFSMAAQWAVGARAGMADPRGEAVFGMLNIVENFLPRAVLLENVAGFLSGPVNAAGDVQTRLDGINVKNGTSYHLRWHVVDAADYGVAQHRRRVLATAFRDLAPLGAPPRPSTSGASPTAWDALSKVRPTKLPVARGHWTALLPCVPEGGNYLHLTARGDGPEIFGYRTRFWSFLLKLARDRPSWTLPASPGPSTGPFHWDNRPLADEERLALQGFPPEWKLTGGERDRVRLIGNATPPPLAEAAGRQIRAVLTGSEETEESVLGLRRGSEIPPPVPPSELPPSFAQFVGSKAAHPGEGVGPGRLTSR